MMSRRRSQQPRSGFGDLLLDGGQLVVERWLQVLLRREVAGAVLEDVPELRLPVLLAVGADLEHERPTVADGDVGGDGPGVVESGAARRELARFGDDRRRRLR
jgi:hypothetical protein